jgi:two-component system cell cycle response regulator
VLAAFSAGADDVMRRPYNDLRLLARLRTFVRVKRMQDELCLRYETADLLTGVGLAEPGREWHGPTAPLLIFDPEPRAIAALSGRLFSALSRPVLRCASAGEAMSSCAAQPVAAVLCGMTAPRAAEASLHLLGQMQADPATRQTPVLAVVQETDHALASRALELGAADVVSPDVQLSELVARIDALDRRRSLSDRLRESVRSGMRLAITDSLTGLYNRHYALRHIQRLIDRSSAADRAFTLMMLDLDGFKAINDRYGHACGDKVLRAVAARLRDNVRNVDLVARHGGEEFLIAMPDAAPETALRAAERVRQAVSTLQIRPAPGLPPLRVTISVGVAVAAPGAGAEKALPSMLEAADQALYASKRAGRNRVCRAGEAA